MPVGCYISAMISEKHMLLSQLPPNLLRSVVQDLTAAGQQAPLALIVGYQKGVVRYYRVAAPNQPFPT